MSEPRKERRRTWMGRYSVSSRDGVLPSPIEGKEQNYDRTPSSPNPSGSGGGSGSSSGGVGGILPFKRSNSGQSLASLVSPRPSTPLTAKKRSGSSTSLSQDGHNGDPNQQYAANPLERTFSSVSTQSASTMAYHPAPSLKAPDARGSGSGSGSFLGTMLSSLSLTRSNQGTTEEERGRSTRKDKDKDKDKSRASSYSGQQVDRDSSGSRARSQSPFRLRRLRRDPSPAVEALTQSDAESDAETARIRPRNAFSFSSVSDDESGDETEDDNSSDESWDEDEAGFDDITEQNTEANALVPPTNAVDQDIPDYLGEGVNVIMPPEPYFPSTLNGAQGRNPRRRKSMKPQDTLPLNTSRPQFQRDRCIISVTHGSPEAVHKETGKPGKRYVLASDLSEESRYALEWGIGTVLRDGDELDSQIPPSIIVTVVENESKVDPAIPNPADRATKLRAQQERQALAYILVRQATSLLQRTRLNVTIHCQAWHAKNSRHMLLDIVDHYEPVMLIVGSRGLGNLKGILLGSTSHYLIQKCSVPVMVARRRLKRPPRRAAHLKAHRARVSLAQAAVDRVASKVDQDVAKMRSEIARDDERRSDRDTGGHTDVEDDVDTEVEGDGPTEVEGDGPPAVEGENSLGEKIGPA
ncbi:hypothetical protein DICSQDRAFT_125895 [Dichomitus squalens LYAD-421 SS1]|uniref:uncharacterized protein n=1 Tax=Dichomitus squalens (strain LYAD-421) TaxID=732165 RepID=UPI000441086C|nr:uncharacterized protein DICSQDRAFT_125895 [Dichomitus squalens LYAD-421 SS1]EJF63444.1 hypothetical protein DICSQDRAFT_125895 [Dichomitus squalens LYAD-421 SS1]